MYFLDQETHIFTFPDGKTGMRLIRRYNQGPKAGRAHISYKGKLLEIVSDESSLDIGYKLIPWKD